jgi:Ca2+-binding RTX toxin-like protein
VRIQTNQIVGDTRQALVLDVAGTQVVLGEATASGDACVSAAVGGQSGSGTRSDVLSGSEGADRLHGAAGNDHLDGGTGRDTLSAGAGNDTVNTAFGSDTVSGARAGMRSTPRRPVRRRGSRAARGAIRRA